MLDWNIGYAGLGRESDFFYDGGKEGIESLKIVEKNFKGILQTISRFQGSVDFFNPRSEIRCKRTHWNNEYKQIGDLLPGYVTLFSKNNDVRYIPIPLTNPLGKVQLGLAFNSKYKTAESSRYAFECNYNFQYSLFFHRAEDSLVHSFKVKKLCLNSLWSNN